MAITASALTSSQTLDEFRREFNKLVQDVNDIQENNLFGSQILFEGSLVHLIPHKVCPIHH